MIISYINTYVDTSKRENFHFEIDSGSMPRNSGFHLSFHSLSALSFTLVKTCLKHTCTRVILSLLDRRHTHTHTHTHTWKIGTKE